MRSVWIGLAGLALSTAVHAKTIAVEIFDSPYDAIQEALLLAEPGDVIELPAGTFALQDGLSLDIADITLRGQGRDATVLNFKGQETGAEGLIITADNAVIEYLAVEDTKGDAIKAKGVDGITFRGLRVEWTDGPLETNGAYGLYPVEARNVLIEDCVAIGASDAGIYVGQSQDIIVRNSRAEYNVAGIEIENSYRADVYNNVATNNTGGILVFDLPNLPQQGGHQVRVFNNKSVNNNTDNFAPEGNIVGQVPRGTGVMIIANRDVEIFENEIGDHDTVNVLIASYPKDYDDDEYDPRPKRVHVHHNEFGPAGEKPDGDFGEMLSKVLKTPIPDIVWDGVVTVTERLFGIEENNRMSIHDNGDATFANADAMLSLTVGLTFGVDRDLANYAEPLPSLPEVTIKQEGADTAAVSE